MLRVCLTNWVVRGHFEAISWPMNCRYLSYSLVIKGLINFSWQTTSITSSIVQSFCCCSSSAFETIKMNEKLSIQPLFLCFRAYLGRSPSKFSSKTIFFLKSLLSLVLVIFVKITHESFSQYWLTVGIFRGMEWFRKGSKGGEVKTCKSRQCKAGTHDFVPKNTEGKV